MDLQVGTGVVEYNLNGKVKVHFNPADASFVKKLMGVFDDIEATHNKYTDDLKKTSDPKRVFEIAGKVDADMRKMLDGVFDVPVCDALFGDMNVYALADGLPVWTNLLLSVLDVCYSSFDGVDDAMEQRIRKYTAKYERGRAMRSK